MCEFYKLVDLYYAPYIWEFYSGKSGFRLSSNIKKVTGQSINDLFIYLFAIFFFF